MTSRRLLQASSEAQTHQYAVTQGRVGKQFRAIERFLCNDLNSTSSTYVYTTKAHGRIANQQTHHQSIPSNQPWISGTPNATCFRFPLLSRVAFSRVRRLHPINHFAKHQSLSFSFFFPAHPLYFRRKLQPSVSLALPPVGWQRTCEHPAHVTTVWAVEKSANHPLAV